MTEQRLTFEPTGNSDLDFSLEVALKMVDRGEWRQVNWFLMGLSWGLADAGKRKESQLVKELQMKLLESSCPNPTC